MSFKNFLTGFRSDSEDEYEEIWRTWTSTSNFEKKRYLRTVLIIIIENKKRGRNDTLRQNMAPQNPYTEVK